MGDPISAITLTEVGCMAGTMQGRVWLFVFDTQKVEMLCAYSDEGVRGLHLDEEVGCATLSEVSRSWWKATPFTSMNTISFRTLVKKSSQNVKHVLQRGAWACVLFPVSTAVVDVCRQEHHHREFKLFDLGNSAEVAPCDYDGESLLLIDRTTPETPAFKLVQLEKNEHTDIEGLPRASSVSLLRLWSTDCLAYVAGGSTLWIYDFRKNRVRHRLPGHADEIIAMDAEDATRIVTLSKDGCLKWWDGETGKCTRSTLVPEATFFLGFPVCLRALGSKALVSGDQGVYLLEFDDDSAG